MTAHVAEPWVDAKAVATHLCASRSYILDLAMRGEIPAHPLPSRGGKRSHWRFKLSEVDVWLAKRNVRPLRRVGGTV